LQDYLMYNSCSSKVHSKSAVNTQHVASWIWLLQFAYNPPLASLVVLVKNYHHTAFDFRWGHHPFKVTRWDRYPYAVPDLITLVPKPVGNSDSE
jgi:hypothetical protein